MRKHRSWLMGFGIGLIVGAIMLQMILFAEKQDAPLAKEPLKAEELADEAKKAGLLLLTPEQLDARVNEARAEANGSGAEGQEGASGQPDDASEKQPVAEEPEASESNAPASETPSAGQNEANPASETEPQQVSLYVSYGMSLTEVGEELQKLGAIDDVKEFIEETRPVAAKMRVGTIVLKGRPTYQEIMDELVRKK
ncbi:hypothetical protein [Cohnella sp.]|uniref:hypothetical protein n=1 Tax=Cohnella sp. TaxID=1883426 RepID=UPI003703B5D8